ncbi:MAG TPA: (deoxy)nucleoside triphosphate pyrophosphohydrolase, partial [Verrucomicrobiae bacterium]|nr:(deoxy)nucleoside triphosphate pyrophosphohydrolase [Verrucomicrobiae bacterium]
MDADDCVSSAGSFRGPSGASGVEIDVAAGLVFRKGKLLIAQRRQGVHLGGLWEFPGGKREVGESFQDCLRRELREEVGIDVKIGALLGTVTHAYPEKTVHLKFYRCELRRQEPRALGCDAIAWVGPDELGQFRFPAAD